MVRRRAGISAGKLAAVTVLALIIVAAGTYLIVSETSRPVTVTSTSTSIATSTSTSIATSTTTAVSTSTSVTTTTATSVSTVVSTASTSSSSSSTPAAIPSTVTWETFLTPQYLDPEVAYTPYDSNVYQNVYENLIWYNYSSPSLVVPWLAQSYAISSDGKTANFTLRSGITFADGEPLNSSAVYFSFNRLMVLDGSSPVGHGTQASWIIFQLANKSLSSTLSGPHAYSQAWADAVLAQNFVQVTGPLTFVLHIQNPNSAFPYLLSTMWGAPIVAPKFVMDHDLALWNQTGTGYKLPYPSLRGGEIGKFKQYYMDEVATCDNGITPGGCGKTYLDGSYQGSLAGTGPYTIKSFDPNTNNIMLQARSDYWGGPYPSKFEPQIQTVLIKYIPDQTTRELDLQNAAASGQAMTVDVTNDHLYDVADRNQWLKSGQLVPLISQTSLYGPYSSFTVSFDPFATNVTSPLTGQYYKFQPFADLRFRLAFADAVNISQINRSINNLLGQVAPNAMPPGLPPQGSYNPSIKPIYGYNPVEVQNSLVSAMMHPLNRFRYVNGTPAPPALFNNTFGCTKLNSANQCDRPVAQTLTLAFPTGDSVDQAIMDQIASTVNNVSATYNMGLTVQVAPLPYGQLATEGLSDHLYFWAALPGWLADYPWALDFLGPIFAPGQFYPSANGWNLPQMAALYTDALNADRAHDLAGIVSVSDKMNQLANQQVMYLYTLYTENFFVFTSNVHGFYFNPAYTGIYFASLY